MQNMTDPHHSQASRNEWHALGELELPVASDAAELLQAGLPGILAPLELRADLQDKIVGSVQEAARRAMQAESALEFGHIHVAIFVPHEYQTQRGTWGFFHIERLEGAAGDSTARNHAIDLYLYVEGDENNVRSGP
jgi:hypothetical protein